VSIALDDRYPPLLTLTRPLPRYGLSLLHRIPEYPPRNMRWRLPLRNQRLRGVFNIDDRPD
jgi:hypothetical protein